MWPAFIFMQIAMSALQASGLCCVSFVLIALNRLNPMREKLFAKWLDFFSSVHRVSIFLCFGPRERARAATSSAGPECFPVNTVLHHWPPSPHLTIYPSYTYTASATTTQGPNLVSTMVPLT